MENSTNGDRRRSERYKTLNFVSYRDEADNGETIAAGVAQTIDLSENGAMILLQRPLNNPRVAELELALEDEIIPIPGEIVEQFLDSEGLWRIRVEFKNLKPFIRHKLQTFIINFR